jgi:hypothetical protein
VTLEIDVFHNESHQVQANLKVRNFGPSNVILTFTLPDVWMDKEDLGDDPIFTNRVWDSRYDAMWATDVKLFTKTPMNGGAGATFAEFLLPDDTFPTPALAAVQARLPAIGIDESGWGALGDAPLAYAQDGFHANPNGPPSLFTSSNKFVHDKPEEYTVPSGAKVQTLYWEPKTLVTTETIPDIADLVPLDTIQVNTPSTGTLQGRDFVWSGSFGLSAALLATNRSMADKRARNDFLSGVFLATSAAALIALIQEAPDQWPWRWWRRRRKPVSAEEIDVGPPTPPHQSVKEAKVEGT